MESRETRVGDLVKVDGHEGIFRVSEVNSRTRAARVRLLNLPLGTWGRTRSSGERGWFGWSFIHLIERPESSHTYTVWGHSRLRIPQHLSNGSILTTLAAAMEFKANAPVSRWERVIILDENDIPVEERRR